jgi:hypothetical protein
MRELAPRLAALRAQFERSVHGMGAVIFGAGAPRIPNTSYFAFPGIEGETLVIELDKAGFAVAPGAACSSANPEPSATLSDGRRAGDRARRGAVLARRGEHAGAGGRFPAGAPGHGDALEEHDGDGGLNETADKRGFATTPRAVSSPPPLLEKEGRSDSGGVVDRDLILRC